MVCIINSCCFSPLVIADILPDCMAKDVGLRIVLDLHIMNLSQMFHETFRG